MLIDNHSVVVNVTLPSSCLKKKHNSIAYHQVRGETITANVITIAHVYGTNNIADIATKGVRCSSGLVPTLKPTLWEEYFLDFSPEGELQRNVLTEPVLVDLYYST
jgi:hypothetical protein